MVVLLGKKNPFLFLFIFLNYFTLEYSWLSLKGFAFPAQFLKIIYYWLQWVFVTVHRLSLVEASGGFSSCCGRAFSLWRLLVLQSTSSKAFRLQQLWPVDLPAPGMCNLPRPGIEPMSPPLTGRFPNTGPPGKRPPFCWGGGCGGGLCCLVLSLSCSKQGLLSICGERASP